MLPISGTEEFGIVQTSRSSTDGGEIDSNDDIKGNKVLFSSEARIHVSKSDADITVDSLNSSDEEILKAEKRLLRKIDSRLLPLLVTCYFLQYLDKGSLGFASILGIIQDLKLQGQQYSWSISIFFFGYLLFSYPTSVLIVKFPVGKYVAVTVILWSVVLMLHAACHNFGGLATVRFFLGIGEATVVPAFAILVGTFYKREEQPLRQCVFFLGDGFGGILGGLIAYGVAHIHNKLEVWKYLFLIYGAVTIGFGFVLFFMLPGDPSSAKFLTAEEKELAYRRIHGNGGKKVGVYKRYQVIEALSDPQTWLLVLNTFSVNIATGGLSAFGNIILKGFGFSLFSTLLLQIPGAIAQMIFISIGAYFGTYVKNARLFTMVFFMLVSITGTCMMCFLPAHLRIARFAGACLCSAFSANLPMATSLVTSNIIGFTKKATVMALIFIAYCVGRIAGPHFFFASESPSYPTGLKTLLVVFASAGIIALILRFYLARENRMRDQEVAGGLVARETEDDEDLTDRENRTFRYLL